MLRYRRFIEAVPDAMVIVDGAGEIIAVNQHAEVLFGYPRAELIGQKVEVLIPMPARAGHEQHCAEFADAPQVRPMGVGLQRAGRRRDGSEIAVEVSLCPVDSGAGMVVVAAIRDMTERLRLEAAARASDDRLRQAVEIQDDALAVFAVDGRLVLHNRAYRALVPAAVEGPLTGCTLDEIIEATSAALVFGSEADRAAFRAQYREGLRAEAGRGTFGQAGRSYRVTRRCTLNNDLVVTIADRTDDERGVEALRRASAAKTEFLAAMSHELRTPLHAILGFATLLMRDRKTPLAERQKDMVQYILKGCDHLIGLVDDVLDLAQIDSGRMTLAAEPVALGSLIAEVMLALQPDAARAGIALRLVPMRDDLPLVFADRARIFVVLMSFGSNAIKYGRRGGHATFGVTRTDSGDVRLFVNDDGMGIAEECQPQVFQPFQRAGQEMGPIEGMGIGLALSQRLATLMDGRVGFRSAAGRGSTFWLDLRAYAGPAPSA